jgi:hypothetical protein
MRRQALNVEKRERCGAMTKIYVRSNFLRTKKKVDHLILEEKEPSLMSCLSALEKVMNVKLVNSELGELYPELQVTVNGVDSNFLPGKLAAGLNDGDSLGISFIMLGGG